MGLVPSTQGQVRVELTYRLSQIASVPVALLLLYLYYTTLCGVCQGVFQKILKEFFYSVYPFTLNGVLWTSP